MGRPRDHRCVLLKMYDHGLNQILEREAQRNVEMMWLAGRLASDFETIADFKWAGDPCELPAVHHAAPSARSPRRCDPCLRRQSFRAARGPRYPRMQKCVAPVADAKGPKIAALLQGGRHETPPIRLAALSTRAVSDIYLPGGAA